MFPDAAEDRQAWRQGEESWVGFQRPEDDVRSFSAGVVRAETEASDELLLQAMDLDAVPVGMYDHEVQLLGETAEVFHITHLLHVSQRGERVHIAGLENCP